MKRAIIVGGTSGIGREVALGLLQRGYLVGIAGRHVGLLGELQQEHPGQVFVKTIDVTNPDAPDKLRQLIDDMGGMDLYFHSSGYGKENGMLRPEWEYATVMTNGVGFTQMIDTAFNYFKVSRREGHIAFISSIAGYKGLGLSPSYSATKRFQWIYAESLSQLAHMQRLPITFTDIRPGFVDTAFIAGANYPMKLDKRRVAWHILKALERKRRKVVIDWRYRLLCHVWQLLPGWLWERMSIGKTDSPYLS